MLIEADSVVIRPALNGVVLRSVARSIRQGAEPVTVELIQLIDELRAATGLRIAAIPAGARTGGNDRWTSDTPMITVNAAAALLGIKPRAVRARIAAGTLPADKFGGRQWWLTPSTWNGR